MQKSTYAHVLIHPVENCLTGGSGQKGGGFGAQATSNDLTGDFSKSGGFGHLGGQHVTGNSITGQSCVGSACQPQP
jgi:hypothetical protein